MDVTHAWGAILLLDEADVFLEQRQAQDVHRNALVSVFLRLLEYYQGILFLTTNRVQTFDEAFQSRIHMGIGYKELAPKAMKDIWQYYVGKVAALKTQNSVVFTDADYEQLSRKPLNGRQVCVFSSESCIDLGIARISRGYRLGRGHIMVETDTHDRSNTQSRTPKS
jgi:AAA+ superfamily predicted ATPase